MKGYKTYIAAFFFVLLAQAVLSTRHSTRLSSHQGEHHHDHGDLERASWPGISDDTVVKPNSHAEGSWQMKVRRRADTLEIAGSSLPDCSHACGSCSPCRLVVVSFVCASVADSETCPISYKCMCNSKSYPVP